jgi:signal transduction histidine kinase
VRPSRWPVRVRLTALYVAAFLAAGIVLVAVTYWVTAQSLGQHVEASGSQLHGDTRLADIVRERIDAYRTDALSSLLAWSTFALIGALVVAALAGWALARRALRPLNQITATANRIADRSLHERIALTGPDDELKQLADTIDAMLDRLDRAFEAQQRFVANASHELRTPLAINRTMLEVAASDPDASEDLRSLAPRLLATNQRSERLVDGLLMLARSDQELSERTPIDLADMARAAAEHERSEAATRKVTLALDLRPAPTTGSPVLVERLAQNLIQNAARHGGVGADATVRTGVVNGHAVLRVENTGPVLPPDEVDQLFEPFRRGSGRTVYDGAGLGLSIVRSVTRAHGGRVTAQPRPGGGLVVEVTLPVEP